MTPAEGARGAAKLTTAQRAMLAKAARRVIDGAIVHGAGAHATACALARRGLGTFVSGESVSSGRFRINDAGRAALRESEAGHGE